MNQRLLQADPKVEKLLTDAVRCGMRMPDAATQELMFEDFSHRINLICSRIEDPQIRHEIREAVRDALDCHSFYRLAADHAMSSGWAPGYAGREFFKRYGVWPRFQPLHRSFWRAA